MIGVGSLRTGVLVPINTYIVLLNWNGWRDTIDCLESLFRLDDQNFRVLVCDNASADDSLEKIRSWSRGELNVECGNHGLSWMVSPPIRKPILLDEATLPEAYQLRFQSRLVLVQTGSNLGFAGGNNIGMRIALQDPACNFVWLLNPDTIAAPGALTALHRKLEEDAAVGICGSLNRAYYAPSEIQAQGGKSYNFWTGRVRKQPKSTSDGTSVSARPLDYINGASMFVTRHFLETVGLMEESYFLYFEELDWAMRAKGGFQLAYASDSVIYHKEGTQLGSSPDRLKRSLLADRYISRNRVLFARRFVPWTLPTVMVSLALAAMERLVRGDAKRSVTMLRSMIEGLTCSKKSTHAQLETGNHVDGVGTA